MTRLVGFPAQAPAKARALILGSFPSVQSLALGRYYGNARNHFWPLLAAALGVDCPPAYEERLALLREGGLALWDVIESCRRDGSLDKDISDERPNAILPFLAAQPSIGLIVLNGGKAAASFARLLCPEIGSSLLGIGLRVEWRPAALEGRLIDLLRLPSTSPIPTRDYRSAADKSALWSAALADHHRGP